MKLIVEIIADGASITDTAGTFTVDSMGDLSLLYRLVALANRYPAEGTIVVHSKPSKLLIYTDAQERQAGITVTPLREGLTDTEKNDINTLFNL